MMSIHQAGAPGKYHIDPEIINANTPVTWKERLFPTMSACPSLSSASTSETPEGVPESTWGDEEHPRNLH
jgi:hypothetical protein